MSGFTLRVGEQPEQEVQELRNRLTNVFACLTGDVPQTTAAAASPETGSLRRLSGAARGGSISASSSSSPHPSARSVLLSRQAVPSYLKSSSYSHYSLDDVRHKSDQANNAAALAFLGPSVIAAEAASPPTAAKPGTASNRVVAPAGFGARRQRPAPPGWQAQEPVGGRGEYSKSHLSFDVEEDDRSDEGLANIDAAVVRVQTMAEQEGPEAGEKQLVKFKKIRKRKKKLGIGMWKLRCAFCWVLCGCFHTVAGSQIRLTIKDALLKSGVESKPPRQLGRDQAQAAYNSLADELAAEAKQGGMEEGGGGGILMDSVQVHTERLSGAPCTGSKCRKLEYVFKVKKLLPTAEALERLEQMHGVQLVGARVEAVDPLEGIHTSGTTAGRMQGSVVSFEENRGLYRVAWDTGAQDLMRREQLFLHALQAPVSEGDLQGMALAQAFFQFLALPEEALWVNLSPNQSDKIMHPDLSVTRAGDVLLRADYHLKNSTAFLLHPDDPTGKQFWDLLALPFPTPELCLPFRTWIHPVSSGVRVVEQGDHLFVVSAGLTVSAESSDLLQRAAATAPQDSCVAANEATQQRAESLFRQLVIPQLLQKIRLDSSLFEELQKVFYWRVIAQWYKQQSPAYLDDIGLDPDSLARPSWETFSQTVASERMRAVFDKYTNDVANGAYNDEKIYRVQPSGKLFARTYSHGAIDFSGKLDVF